MPIPFPKRDAGGSVRGGGVESIPCDRGRVLGLSIQGLRLRVRKPWAPGERRDVCLGAEHDRLTLPARCVWARREGLFHWTLGLTFEDATPDQLRAAGEMAMIHAAGAGSIAA